jgi:hypothetical protein
MLIILPDFRWKKMGGGIYWIVQISGVQTNDMKWIFSIGYGEQVLSFIIQGTCICHGEIKWKKTWERVLSTYREMEPGSYIFFAQKFRCFLFVQK